MKTLAYISIFIGWIVSSGFVYTVGSTQVAVKVNKFGIKKGISQKYYGPGTYFYIPLFCEWYIFDTNVKNLEMVFNPQRKNPVEFHDHQRPTKATMSALKFKTIDGNDISLDVTVTYRILPEMVTKILDLVAAREQDVENIVKTIIRSRPRDIFGELTTEEFYVSEKRTSQSQKVRVELNHLLNPYGIVVEKVWTRSYRFNEFYMQAIQEKLVAEQQERKNKSTINATREEYKKRIQDAIGEKNKLVAKANGEYEQTRISADAYFKQKQFEANAIECEGRAQAEAILSMNQALNSAGGQLMVEMKVADALKGKSIMLLPVSGASDLKVTDMNQLIHYAFTKKYRES